MVRYSTKYHIRAWVEAIRVWVEALRVWVEALRVWVEALRVWVEVNRANLSAVYRITCVRCATKPFWAELGKALLVEAAIGRRFRAVAFVFYVFFFCLRDNVRFITSFPA
jgi:hypothetical protein